MSTYVANTTGIFEELVITARMPTPVVVYELSTDDSIVYPVTSNVAIMPLESKEYTYTKVPYNNVTVHTMMLTNKFAELYSFALWGRRFATDGQVEDPPLPDEEIETSETPTTPAPGASTVHLLNKLLLTCFVVFVCIRL